jgi:small subunit ribosomal protein S17
MSKDSTTRAKQMRGIVTSTKMDKTIVVSVTTFKTHPKYKKKYKSSKKYKVHDENNTYEQGQEVQFVACKPISKDKAFTVVG